MLAIASLERSSCMSENTQDEYEPLSPLNADETAQKNEATIPEPGETDQAEGVEAEVPDLSPVEGALPPEAQGETNGGPLGCCLGVMMGLLLSLSLAIVSRLYADPLGQLFQS